MGRYITRSPAETQALGEALAAVLRGGEVLAFTGGLGAGKTTFCQGLAKGLGLSEAAHSPSYAIVNYYNGPLPMAHFDAWRIAGYDDLEAAGFYDYRDAGAVVAVEWSENIAAFLEEPVVRISMGILAENEREIVVEGAEGF